MKTSAKATHEQLKQHNLHLLLRTVYSGQADNRAALAQHSGLAKPTVSELVAELMDTGLLVEDGHGQSTESGGKRPRLLRFVPTARQVIGVSLDTVRASAMLANLDGQVVARHSTDLNGKQGDDALTLLRETINGLIAQLDAPLLCLGIGVPGNVANDTGVVRESAYLGWRDLPLARLLAEAYQVPTHVANTTELAAMAQFSFAPGERIRNLVTILINQTIEIGITLGGAVYHYGTDIGCLHVAPSTNEADVLQSYLTLPAVRARALVLAQRFPSTTLPLSDLTYLDIRQARLLGDPLADALFQELADHLALLCAWVIALLRPDHIVLVGPVADLGDALLARIAEKVAARFESESVDAVSFSFADSANVSALGAVANALQNELGIF